jgi:hypothetical protein
MVDDTSERAHPFQLHHHHEYLYIFSLVLSPGSANTSATMPAMQYFPKARSDFKPPLVANENAYLGVVASSYVRPTPLHPYSSPLSTVPRH